MLMPFIEDCYTWLKERNPGRIMQNVMKGSDIISQIKILPGTLNFESCILGSVWNGCLILLEKQVLITKYISFLYMSHLLLGVVWRMGSFESETRLSTGKLV